MKVLIAHGLWVVFLTVTTQIGGLAWLISRFSYRRYTMFFMLYVVFTVVAGQLAVSQGRVSVPCGGNGALQMRSWAYCAANRNYMKAELKWALDDSASKLARQYPGTVTQVLDAGFPLFEGFPMFPRMSLRDGGQADIALYYAPDGEYKAGATRSPIGYFAFEDGPTDCDPSWGDFRSDLAWVQKILPDMPLDADRTAGFLQLITQDDRISRLYLEPHLKEKLGLTSEKIQFQGCKAPRHDDHIHISL